MNIKFIGTGTMASTTRNNTSILVDNILLDCGMGTIKQLERLGDRVKDIHSVVITHYHADHFFDIPNLIIGRKLRGEKDNVLNIIGPIGIRRKVYDMMAFSFGKFAPLEEYANLKFIELKPNETINIDNYELTAIELDHGDAKPSYGYMLSKDNTTIAYTGDTTICDNLYKMCEKATYIMVDACKATKSNPAHIGLTDLLEVVNNYKNCKFYTVHREDYEIQESDNVIFPVDGDVLRI